MDIIERLDMLATAVGGDVKDLETTIGNIEDLTTEQKETIVAAINSIVQVTNTLKEQTSVLEQNSFTKEQKENILTSLKSIDEVIKNHDKAIGDKKYLLTKNKESIVDSINSLFELLNTNTASLTEKVNQKVGIEEITPLKKRISVIENVLKAPTEGVNKALEVNNTIATEAKEEADQANNLANEANTLVTRVNTLVNNIKTTVDTIKNKTEESKNLANEAKAIAEENKTKLETKLDKASELHVKKGTYNVNENGSLTLIQVDGTGTEKESEKVIIEGIATKESIDSLNSKIGNLSDLKTENKASIVDAINFVIDNQAKQACKNLEGAIENFKKKLGVNPEIEKINGLSTDPFDLLLTLVKNYFKPKTEEPQPRLEPQPESIPKAANYMEGIGCFLADTKIIPIPGTLNKNNFLFKEIKMIQGNINKNISFDTNAHNIIIPEEIDITQNFDIEVYDNSDHILGKLKCVSYPEYIKRDRVLTIEDITISSNENKKPFEEEEKIKEEDFRIISNNNIAEEYYKRVAIIIFGFSNKIVTFINPTLTEYYNPQKKSWQPISDLINFDIKNELSKLTINRFFDNFEDYLNNENTLCDRDPNPEIKAYDKKMIYVMREEQDFDNINRFKTEYVTPKHNQFIVINDTATKILNRTTYEWVELTQEQKESLKNKVKQVILRQLDYVSRDYVKTKLDTIIKPHPGFVGAYTIDKNNYTLNGINYGNLYNLKEQIVIDKVSTKFYLDIFTKQWESLGDYNITKRMGIYQKLNFDKIFNNAYEHRNEYFPTDRIGKLTFTDDVSSVIEKGEYGVETFILTKEEYLKNASAETPANTIPDIPVNRLFLNETATKYYDNFRKQWLPLNNENFKNFIQEHPVFKKYKEFLEKKITLLEKLKTVNFNDKITNETPGKLSFTSLYGLYSNFSGHDIVELNEVEGEVIRDEDDNEGDRNIVCKIFSAPNSSVLHHYADIVNANEFYDEPITINKDKIKIRINNKKEIGIVFYSNTSHEEKTIKINKDNPLFTKLTDILIPQAKDTVIPDILE